MTQPEAHPDEWDDEQINLFETLKALMVAAQEQFTHPCSAEIPTEHWETIAHNTAYLAALIAGGATDITVLNDDDQVEFIHVIRPGVLQ